MANVRYEGPEVAPHEMTATIPSELDFAGRHALASSPASKTVFLEPGSVRRSAGVRSRNLHYAVVIFSGQRYHQYNKCGIEIQQLTVTLSRTHYEPHNPRHALAET
jgi:hypothetical protein